MALTRDVPSLRKAWAHFPGCQNHVTSLPVALPLSCQTCQFISISRLFTAHPYTGHLPPAGGILQSTSIAHLHCQQQTLQVPCSAACGRALLHHSVTLLRCPLEVCTSTTPMKTQGKFVTRGGGRCGLPSACTLLWVRPTSPLTLCAGLLQRTFTER